MLLTALLLLASLLIFLLVRFKLSLLLLSLDSDGDGILLLLVSLLLLITAFADVPALASFLAVGGAHNFFDTHQLLHGVSSVSGIPAISWQVLYSPLLLALLLFLASGSSIPPCCCWRPCSC
jgi:hypothetical protein